MPVCKQTLLPVVQDGRHVPTAVEEQCLSAMVGGHCGVVMLHAKTVLRCISNAAGWRLVLPVTAAVTKSVQQHLRL